MDRFEVTNREFKRFVDAGGYRRRDVWDYPFVKDGRVISWEEAMARMTDRTGRTGPATWEAGDYATGQENHPVAGVSWYEAADEDRKSTRLNSSHGYISYAVFCLKKKKSSNTR